MLSRDSLRSISYVIFNVGMLSLSYYLLFINKLSYDQSYMFYFGALGVFVAIDFLLLNPKTGTIFEGYQIPVMFTLVFGIVLLTSFLITSSINSAVSVIILCAVDLSMAGILGFIEWNSKRKQKQSLT
jgi:hypothetical protein